MKLVVNFSDNFPDFFTDGYEWDISCKKPTSKDIQSGGFRSGVYAERYPAISSQDFENFFSLSAVRGYSRRKRGGLNGIQVKFPQKGIKRRKPGRRVGE